MMGTVSQPPLSNFETPLLGTSNERDRARHEEYRHGLQSELQTFLVQQSQENPRLRRLRKKWQEPVTSISHPSRGSDGHDIGEEWGPRHEQHRRRPRDHDIFGTNENQRATHQQGAYPPPVTHEPSSPSRHPHAHHEILPPHQFQNPASQNPMWLGSSSTPSQRYDFEDTTNIRATHPRRGPVLRTIRDYYYEDPDIGAGWQPGSMMPTPGPSSHLPFLNPAPLNQPIIPSSTAPFGYPGYPQSSHPDQESSYRHMQSNRPQQNIQQEAQARYESKQHEKFTVNDNLDKKQQYALELERQIAEKKAQAERDKQYRRAPGFMEQESPHMYQPSVGQSNRRFPGNEFQAASDPSTDKKAQYMRDLQEQMVLKQQLKEQERLQRQNEDIKKQQEIESYSPFGKGGSGAPQGSVSPGRRRFPNQHANSSTNGIFPSSQTPAQVNNIPPQNPFAPSQQMPFHQQQQQMSTYPPQNMNNVPQGAPNFLDQLRQSLLQPQQHPDQGTLQLSGINGYQQPQMYTPYNANLGSPTTQQPPIQSTNPNGNAERSYLRGVMSVDSLDPWKRDELTKKQKVQSDIQEALRKQIAEKEAEKARKEAQAKMEEQRDQERLSREQEMLREKYVKEQEEARKKEEEAKLENERQMAEKKQKQAAESGDNRDSQTGPESKSSKARRKRQEALEHAKLQASQNESAEGPVQPSYSSPRAQSPPIPAVLKKMKEEGKIPVQQTPEPPRRMTSPPQTQTAASVRSPAPEPASVNTHQYHHNTHSTSSYLPPPSHRYDQSNESDENAQLLAQLSAIQRELEMEDSKIQTEIQKAKEEQMNPTMSPITRINAIPPSFTSVPEPLPPAPQARNHYRKTTDHLSSAYYPERYAPITQPYNTEEKALYNGIEHRLLVSTHTSPRALRRAEKERERHKSTNISTAIKPTEDFFFNADPAPITTSVHAPLSPIKSTGSTAFQPYATMKHQSKGLDQHSVPSAPQWLSSLAKALNVEDATMDMDEQGQLHSETQFITGGSMSPYVPMNTISSVNRGASKSDVGSPGIVVPRPRRMSQGLMSHISPNHVSTNKASQRPNQALIVENDEENDDFHIDEIERRNEERLLRLMQFEKDQNLSKSPQGTENKSEVLSRFLAMSPKTDTHYRTLSAVLETSLPTTPSKFVPV